jgi:Bacterial pre-peptidase C-terminal domain
MHLLPRAVGAALLLAVAALAAHAQELPVPQLKSVFPAGARQGTSVEVEAAGVNLEATTKLYFSNPGITAELLPLDPKADPKADPKTAPAHFKVSVAANVPVGDYDVRSIGQAGISNPRVFCVSDCVEVNETEPNDARDKANRVPFNCIVNGRVSPSEDVDWYVFPAKKGQRVIVECRAWRIDSRLDGTLNLYDSEGKELVASQDENIRDQKRDPFIDFDVPADGDYYLKFSDFIYNGGADYFYRLSIGTQPYVDFITPTGAKPGTTADVTFYGRNLPGGEPRI